MVHLAMAHIIHLMPCIFSSPTQVYFFLMGKIVFVKATKFFKNITFDEHASTRGPKHFFDVVVLSFVLFYGLKYSTPAKRITEHIYKPSSGPGILKMVFFN